ncbi:general transcription factor IIH subunit 3 [Polyodon spathula]|uniref:general transcription factor IIH subunit 3 n=1 Tax=Polyodon spathula TaxID=7913 RepID=UPI001B7F56C1|nr:general transcription factor IIH subunit 3 [Polyodon spathula]
MMCCNQATWELCYTGRADDELSLLVVVVDVNPVWWGQQAQKEPEFTLSECMDAVMVMSNTHLVMTRSNKLAIIASHCQESHFLYPSKHVIKAADDSALQYMNFMNVIFAAQKQSVSIDACVLDADSGLLQQACDITGGLYLKVPQKMALAQYLLWVYLPDTDQRSQLVLPPPVHVDYRAACFCHRNLIEIGYVCSVCLSIFCNFSPICTTCETAFKIALPHAMKAKKKKLKPTT